jgi:hypothetical protein
MKRNPFIAGLLSLIIPGMGQIYCGKTRLGAGFLLAVIIVGNLNAIWLSIYAGTQTDLSFFSDTFPRLLHDIFAGYGIVFWLWQVVNAYQLASQKSS